ncbi:MAG: GreA/GreB family elongation factor [Alphaproteobacteria bacterium]
MSRAFVKEDDIGADVALPERPLGEARNFVTARGLAQIDAGIARLSQALATETAENRPALARDLRYWSARRESAEVIAPPADDASVRFASLVTLEYEDGTQRRYRIVGIDEADPQAGLLSHAAPLAAALLGRKAGESVTVAGKEAQIVVIAH